MGTTWLLFWKNWRKRPLRVVLSVCSVAIAVAAVLSTGLAANSARDAYSQLSESVEGAPAVDVVAKEGGKLFGAEVPELDQVPGVASSLKMSTRSTYLQTETKRYASLMLGVERDQKGAEQIKLLAGELPDFDDQIALSAAFAQAAQLKVGDWLTMVTLRGMQDVEVCGLLDTEQLSGLVPGASSVIALETLQGRFLQRDKLDRVRLFLNTREAKDAVLTAVAARLPPQLTVQGPQSRIQVADEMLKGAELALRFASTLAVAMSIFVVLNVLRTSFHERRRQFAMLRCVGATQWQVTRLMVAEGLVFGVLGAVLGLPLGLAGAQRVAAALAAVLKAPPPTLEISWPQVGLAAAVGLLASLFAAYLPSRHFRKMSPLEALSSNADARKEKLPWSVVLWGLAAWFGAMTIMSGVIRQKLPPSMATPAGVLMLMAFLVATPILLDPLVRSFGWLVGRVLGLEAKLASQQLMRRRTRTTLTVSVLVIAAANAIGLGHSILNNVADIRAWYARSMVGDAFMVRDTEQNTALGALPPEEFVNKVRALPDLKHLITARIVNARINTQAGSCIVRDFPPEVPLQFALEGNPDPLLIRQRMAAGEVIVSTPLARRLKCKVGEEIYLDVSGRTIKGKICGLASDYTFGGLACFLDAGYYGPSFSTVPLDFVMAGFKSTPPKPDVLKQFAALSDQQGFSFQSLDGMKARLERILQGILAALWTLLALGFVVGGFGVANALLVSVTEQTRELGLLRLSGMTQGQAARMVAAEALILGLVGGLLGLCSGLTSAWIMQMVNVPLLGHRIEFIVRHGVIWGSVAGLIAISLAAAWAPGRRAAQLNVLTAISVE